MAARGLASGQLILGEHKMYKLILTITTAATLLVACTKTEEPAPAEQVPGQAAPLNPQDSKQPTIPPPPVESQNGAPGAANLAAGAPAAAPVLPPVEPYRTWITLEGFVMESNGDPENPISNVRLEVLFPAGQKLELPGNGQFWTIGNGQVQEIKQTFEIPWNAVQHDGFNFTVQMVRKGSDLLPCKFDVRQLSQFNRKYICHTDVAWQLGQKIPENKLDKEGIEVRVFTDKNTPAKELPKESLALK